MNESRRDTAVHRLGGLNETRWRVEVSPQVTTAVDVEGNRLPWIKPRNARAGVVENRWVHENEQALNSFRGLWIAVLGTKVLASGQTLPEVYDFLRSQGHADALVMKVPQRTGPRPYLIA